MQACTFVHTHLNAFIHVRKECRPILAHTHLTRKAYIQRLTTYMHVAEQSSNCSPSETSLHTHAYACMFSLSSKHSIQTAKRINISFYLYLGICLISSSCMSIFPTNLYGSRPVSKGCSDTGCMGGHVTCRRRAIALPFHLQFAR